MNSAGTCLRTLFLNATLAAAAAVPAAAAMSASPSLDALRRLSEPGPGTAARIVDGRSSRPAMALVEAGAPGQPHPPLHGLSERGRRILDPHQEPIIKPDWLPSFINDVPSYRLVEGPTADQDGFLQRLWRVPASPFIATFGGMKDLAGQWSRAASDGGDRAGWLIGGALGGLFGFLAGLAVGAAGTLVNAGMSAWHAGRGTAAAASGLFGGKS